jgi:predicted translin family RNA/ssDNA-binding protein
MNIEAAFATFGDTLNKESDRRDELKKLAKDVDDQTRSLQVAVQGVHEDLAKGVASLDVKLGQSLPIVQAAFAKLSAAIDRREFTRYKFMWQNDARDLTYVVVLTHWLKSNELLSLQTVASAIGMGVDGGAAATDGKLISLEIEDYLMGLALIPNELSRLAINCVTKGDFQTPLRISHFVQSLFSAFQLLNLKNDFLRKKYDSIKYDVNKVEGVLYDLKVRGLIATVSSTPISVVGFVPPTTASTTTTTTTSTSSAMN